MDGKYSENKKEAYEKVVQVKVPERLFNQLQVSARHHSLKPSQLVRAIISKHLNHEII